jgi:molecular chaperone HscB
MAAAQQLGLQSNDFELFDLPQRFELDASALSQRWKALQAQTHPDNFATGSSAEQRLAMQWSVRVNEAYQRLRQPLTRAAYLCELRGVAIDAESNTAMPHAFLMQQMMLREELDEARGNAQALQALADTAAATKREWLQAVAQALDVDADTATAAGAVRALMFIDRVAKDINQQLDDVV